MMVRAGGAKGAAANLASDKAYSFCFFISVPFFHFYFLSS